MMDDNLLSEDEAERRMATINAAVLRDFPDRELHAFNLAVMLYGRVSPDNCSYQRAVDAALIQESGNLWDPEAVKAATAYEIARRQEAAERP